MVARTSGSRRQESERIVHKDLSDLRPNFYGLRTEGTDILLP